MYPNWQMRYRLVFPISLQHFSGQLWLNTFCTTFHCNCFGSIRNFSNRGKSGRRKVCLGEIPYRVGVLNSIQSIRVLVKTQISDRIAKENNSVLSFLQIVALQIRTYPYMEVIQSYSGQVFLNMALCLMLRYCNFCVFKRPRFQDLYPYLKLDSCCYLKYLNLWKICF